MYDKFYKIIEMIRISCHIKLNANGKYVMRSGVSNEY